MVMRRAWCWRRMSVADCLNTTEYAVYVAESAASAGHCPVRPGAGAGHHRDRSADGAAGAAQAPHQRRRARQIVLSVTRPAATASRRCRCRARPATNGWPKGLTHNEAGLPVSGAAAHVAQINKRAKKIRQYDCGDQWGEVWGDGDVAVLAIGSTIGPAREAARRLAEGRPSDPRRRAAPCYRRCRCRRSRARSRACAAWSSSNRTTAASSIIIYARPEGDPAGTPKAWRGPARCRSALRRS